MLPSVSRAFPARLQELLELLQPTEALADVGTDHGLLPAQAVEVGLAERAFACDLRAKPLIGARRLLEERGLLDRIQVLQGDGLAPLAEESISALSFAGMSGSTISQLCSRCPEVVQRVEQLVVQPNRGAHLLRQMARTIGFHLVDERILREGSRYFITLHFIRRSGVDPAYEDLSIADAEHWGPHFIKSRDPVALDYFRSHLQRLSSLPPSADQRYRLERERLERVLSAFA